MTKKQFEEFLKALKGIEAALLLLRVPNTVYIPSPYIAPNPPQPVVPSPYLSTLGDPKPLWGTTTCGGSTTQFQENPKS